MKFKFILFFFIVFNLHCFSQDYYGHIIKAELNRYDGKYASAEKNFRAAFKLNNRKPIDLYAAACLATKNNHKNYAFHLLNLAIDHGYDDIDNLTQDSDLTSLHWDRRWSIICDKLKKKLDLLSKSYNHALKDELLEIRKADQDIRLEYVKVSRTLPSQKKITDSLLTVMSYQDSIDLKKISYIIETYGWPSKRLVGRKANQTVCLVIQHNVSVQDKFLPIMQKAAILGNAEFSDLAYLEDRVAYNNGKEQIFGTQVGFFPSTNKLFVLPVKDPRNVNRRRVKIGLEIMEEYLKNWNAVWSIDSYLQDLPAVKKLNMFK
jgi:hypothetical protein